MPIEDYFMPSQAEDRNPLMIGAVQVKNDSLGREEVYNIIIVDNEGILVRDSENLNVHEFNKRTFKLAEDTVKFSSSH